MTKHLSWLVLYGLRLSLMLLLRDQSVAIEREADVSRCQDFERATENCSNSTLNCCTEEYINSFTKCMGGHADGADYRNVKLESHFRGLQQYCQSYGQPISLPATVVTARETESSAGQMPPLSCERFLCRVLRAFR
ncbi:hypothetical protein BDZ89DRAFT_1072142 [Hymenopellis radicata]|nr:hypothetical protein BDZ89DRAFT_1072142 [Hymenopellis radicata]